MIHLTSIQPTSGTYRTYTVRTPAHLRERFTIHLLSLNKRSERNSWRLVDHLTGAYVNCWNRREAVDKIIEMTTPPLAGDARFLVLPRTTTPVDREDIVLIDRSTGRWWKRFGSDDYLRDEELLVHLTPSW